MNSAIAVGATALLGIFYCWTSRINGLFFFGRTAEQGVRANEAGRAITRHYLTSVGMATVAALATTWAGWYIGARWLSAMGPLLEVVLASYAFARANGQVRELVLGQAAAGASQEVVARGQVRQVALLEQPRYWIPGLAAILLPLGACVVALGTAVLSAAHGNGLSAGWSGLSDSFDKQGDAFLLGMGVGLLAAASGLLLLFRTSVRLRTRMAQYTVRSSMFMEWVGTAMLIGTLVSNRYGVVISRGFGKGVVGVALVATIAVNLWNQARSKQFVPPPVEVGGDDRWRWGLFYVDRGDPALFVQSRCGAGYTLNYGRMAAWPISLGLVVYLVGVLFFLPHHP
jgi:hypothetical protein